jgi:pyruvate kinase
MAIDTAVQLLAHRRTKIVATLGPASSRRDQIERLIDAGVDVFRLNMSHGDPIGHRAAYEEVRAAAAARHKHIAVLADLAGPKIRVGRFPAGPIALEPGRPVVITTRDVPGEPGLIPSQYAGLAADVKAGDRILLADGMMELRVDSVGGTEVSCTVVHGGELADRKGINLPGVAVSAPSLTAKDRADAAFALELGIDFLAQSFVRRASDVAELKALIAEAGHDTPIVAKIERPEALSHCEDILDVADSIMVARGDLGVELPPEQVPVAQRLLVDLARRKNKPVIVATQMLESMIESSRPTRAEVADVSHTTFSGADAIMLSAETATGDHPVAAVAMMSRIARQAEAYMWREGAFGRLEEGDSAPPIPFGDAVARSTAQLSRDLLVRAIVVTSESGMSATTVSAARPSAPVLAVSSRAEICRRMNLMWGVIPVEAAPLDLAQPVALARELVREHALARPGEFILLVRGFHADPLRSTPSITVLCT